MANIPGEIVWQANDNTWFTNNAAEVYPAGITIYHVDGRYKFTDGITALSALSFLGGGSGVQSVTGPNVDNTDPTNPVVETPTLTEVIAEDTTANNLLALKSVNETATSTSYTNSQYINYFVHGSGTMLKGTIAGLRSFFQITYNSVYTTPSAVASQITTALSGYELLSNKQTDLTASATKYPTVDAVNTGLASKLGIVVKDITTSSPLTGTTAITAIKSVSIAANTVQVGDIIEIYQRALKITGTGSVTHYLYVNTSNTLSGATLVGFVSLGSITWSSFNRKLFVLSSNESETVASSISVSTSDPAAIGTVASSILNIDWTGTVWFIQAIANAAVGNQTTSIGMYITRMR